MSALMMSPEQLRLLAQAELRGIGERMGQEGVHEALHRAWARLITAAVRGGAIGACQTSLRMIHLLFKWPLLASRVHHVIKSWLHHHYMQD